MKDLEQTIGDNKLIVVAAAILVIGVSAAVVLYSQVEVEELDEVFPTNATVLSADDSENLTAGIAAGEGMSFGRMDERINQTKFLNLSANEPTLVRVSVDGNISELLDYDRKHLFEDRKQIGFELSGNRSGYFEGEINLDMKVAKNEWGERWLEILYRYF